jgi:hypothetical protein
MGFFSKLAKPFREIGRFGRKNAIPLLSGVVERVLGLPPAPFDPSGGGGGGFDINQFADILNQNQVNNAGRLAPIPTPPAPVPASNDLLSQKNLLMVSVVLTAVYLFKKK